MKNIVTFASVVLVSLTCTGVMASGNYSYSVALTSSDGTVVGMNPGTVVGTNPPIAAALPAGSCKSSSSPKNLVSVNAGDQVQLLACAYGPGVYGATTGIGQVSVDQVAKKLTVRSQENGWPTLVKAFTVTVYSCTDSSVKNCTLAGLYQTTDGNQSVNISPFVQGMSIKFDITGGAPYGKPLRK